MDANNKLKEEVETFLLQAMSGIDKAVHVMVQKLSSEEYEKEVDTLIKSNREIKKVLNKHFDFIARKRGTINA
jgi:hypothetical protein